jgi:hypothetical protein
MREALVESPGGPYEMVTQCYICLLFSCLSRSLLRELWRHEDMLNNGAQSIEVDFSYREGHIVREREILYECGTRTSIDLATLGAGTIGWHCYYKAMKHA